MGKPDFRRLNTRIAYPWPVDAEMPADINMGIGAFVIGETALGAEGTLSLVEILYGPGPSSDGEIGGFVLGWNTLGDEI